MYRSTQAKQELLELYGWQDYGEKHCESVFTDWHIHFYLFTKFGIDKRKAHFSSLINSGQMTRQDALEKLQSNPIYPELGIERKVLKYPKHEHKDYPMDKNYDRIAKIVKLWKSLTTSIRQ